MHPEYLRFLRRRSILRWLLYGVLPLLFLILFIVPAFVGVAPMSPWIRQLAHLRNNHRCFLDYRTQNGRWPTDFEVFSRTVDDSPDVRKPVPFIDPDTHTASPWLLFDPAHVTALPEYGRIIAAAPRTGDYGKVSHQNGRLVLFESGRAIFIPEADFRAATLAK